MAHLFQPLKTLGVRRLEVLLLRSQPLKALHRDPTSTAASSSRETAEQRLVLPFQLLKLFTPYRLDLRSGVNFELDTSFLLGIVLARSDPAHQIVHFSVESRVGRGERGDGRLERFNLW